MRGKKAKQLRALARDLTIGKDAGVLINIPVRDKYGRTHIRAVSLLGTTRQVYKGKKRDYYS